MVMAVIVGTFTWVTIFNYLLTCFLCFFISNYYRKNELHQVAQQASNIEDLTEVIRASLSVMCKQWSDAMHTFHEKFDSLSTLIIDHGNGCNN